MNAQHEDCGTPETEGRFDALMYLQTLVDHGSAIGRDDAGSILAGHMMDLCAEVSVFMHQAIKDGVPIETAFEKLSAFSEVLGEALWERANEKRQAFDKEVCHG